MATSAQRARLNAMRRLAGLDEVGEAPPGPRMSVELADGTTITRQGEQATGYAGNEKDRALVRGVAGQAWRKIPVPVDPKNIYDKNAAAINLDYGMRGVNQMKTGMDVGKLAFDLSRGRPGRDLDAVNNKITEEARLRLDPNALQDRLEAIKTEDVVTGAPGLDVGETMPTAAYGQMQREEAARRAADTPDKNGNYHVQYVRPPAGSRDIARWTHPRTTAELVETIGTGPGKGGKAIPMSPQDAQLYRGGVQNVEAIRAKIKATEAQLRQTGNEELAKTVLPELQREEKAAVESLRTLAGEIKKRPASTDRTGADYPFALSDIEKSIMRDRGLLPGGMADFDEEQEAVRGPEAYPAWEAQAAQVDDLMRKGYRRQATELARQLMGRATVYDWLPDRWAEQLGPQIMGYMREAMKSNPRVDPIGLFQNIRAKLKATVTGELPRGVVQQRQASRQEQAAELADQREQRMQDSAMAREDRAEGRAVKAEEKERATARVKSIEAQIKQEEAEYKQRASEIDQLKAKRDTAKDDQKTDIDSRIKANRDRMQQLDKYIRDLRKKAIEEYDRQAGGGEQGQEKPAGQADSLPTVTTKEKFDALKSGSIYITKDGRKARKP